MPSLAGAASDTWGDLTGKTRVRRQRPRAKETGRRQRRRMLRESSTSATSHSWSARMVACRTSTSTSDPRTLPCVPTLRNRPRNRFSSTIATCIFVPHCMTIWSSQQELHIVNSDPVAQNVAFNPLLDKPANIVIPVDGNATWSFKRAQRVPVPIACNYHPWESAYILPLAHPYVAITGEDGSFTIPKLPTGELEFQIWHERVGYLDTKDWPKGRMKTTIQAGTNDLGTIKLGTIGP